MMTTDATLPNNMVFQNLLAGDYSVTEGAVAGWDLTDHRLHGRGRLRRRISTAQPRT